MLAQDMASLARRGGGSGSTGERRIAARGGGRKLSPRRWLRSSGAASPPSGRQALPAAPDAPVGAARRLPTQPPVRLPSLLRPRWPIARATRPRLRRWRGQRAIPIGGSRWNGRPCALIRIRRFRRLRTSQRPIRHGRARATSLSAGSRTSRPSALPGGGGEVFRRRAAAVERRQARPRPRGRRRPAA